MAASSHVSRDHFKEIFPLLVEDVSQAAKEYGIPAVALEWFQKSLNANVPGGKLNRGLSVPDTVYHLLQRDLKPDEFRLSSTLGWLTELLQAFFLVSDDIMDSSITRRGEPCWYRQPRVGMIAINDGLMLESSIYLILKKHFRSHPAYVDLVELFHEVTFQTELGQLCDLITAPVDHVDLNSFSMDKYRFIIVYKTAYYSFYLPVALALHYLQLASPSNLKQAHDILIPLGEYFQIQDDYLDVFGDPSVIGKIGTDIKDNKCSWLVNEALLRVTPAQRKVLDENYGRNDVAKEARVRELFDNLQLPKVYEEYEEKRIRQIRMMISAVDESEGLKRDVFETFLRKIEKRTK